ncbi:MAG: hypothetical protein OEU51_01065 [Gammaproteobacteria bacterium]|jgi:hypothetical protein|nr:hypothetical protein [Gammaproteobacteria bacterium]
MGRQQESGNSDTHVFGGAVPPVKPFDTGAFLCGLYALFLAESRLSEGANCTGGEMPHLFNVEGMTFSSPGPFTNIKGAPAYWTGTDLPPDPTGAMQFSFNGGSQSALGKPSLTGGSA